MTSVFPESCTYILPNSIRVEITGMDLDDCFETFHKRRLEFCDIKNNVSLNTPRLNEYYSQKRGERTD